jgi:hypothetical protein
MKSLSMALRLSTTYKYPVENNARWCHTVGHTHGAPGELHEHLWLSRRPMPRFYPNVVTLSAEAGAAAQLVAVRELVDAALLGPSPSRTASRAWIWGRWDFTCCLRPPGSGAMQRCRHP